MQRFFQLAFQQAQVSSPDFSDQFDDGANSVPSTFLLQNLQESFARTVIAQNKAGTPFNKSMSTHTYMMTTAMQVAYALTDEFQADDNDAAHDSLKTAYPTATVVVSASAGPIPIAQSVDPTSPNFLHFYDPNVVAECGEDPHTMTANSRTIYRVLLGGRDIATPGAAPRTSRRSCSPPTTPTGG